MSLFIVPSTDRRTMNRGYHNGSTSCGQMALRSPFDVFFDNGSVRHPFVDIGTVVTDEDARYAAYEARLRQQQLNEERRLQERYAALRRQAELERERERRRIRIQAERHEALVAAAAAHAAWQQEQERQVRAAQQQQRRRRQEALAAAERQRAWQQQAKAEAAARQQQQGYDAQVAAAVAQEQWEELAKQGLAVAFDFAKNFFGLEEEKDADDMQVDIAGPSAAPAKAANPAETKDEVTTVEPAVATEPVATKASEKTPEQSQQKLVFTHPLPSDASQRTAIKADDIQVTYDESTRSIRVRGLWQDNVDDTADGHTVTSSDGEEESRGRKRSRSPKRSRVSDVDEKTGEEIASPSNDVDADGFVNVTPTEAKGKQAQGSARIPVPERADVANLRAELTDEGFQVWI